jgi:cation diffusion facilitator CzcD-associated flavoprotein CzcO
MPMKICVIGSGLTTIKQLRAVEHEVTCFEKNADLGGIWFRHEPLHVRPTNQELGRRP